MIYRVSFIGLDLRMRENIEKPSKTPLTVLRQHQFLQAPEKMNLSSIVLVMMGEEKNQPTKQPSPVARSDLCHRTKGSGSQYDSNTEETGEIG